jgi:hypothetical protein
MSKENVQEGLPGATAGKKCGIEMGEKGEPLID